jgi:uncharacterized damage-inducible protein DinB
MTTSDGYLDIPEAGDEVATLLGALDRNRRTFMWKCSGVDSDGMNRTLGPSSVTLAGLVKHLALVEEHSFSRTLLGKDYDPAWDGMDTESDPDWEWNTAAHDSPEDLVTLWRKSVQRSRAAISEALTEGGLDRLATQSPWARTPSLRRLIVDMIEEYARHTGHADLIRESIDGLTGEDAPR